MDRPLKEPKFKWVENADGNKVLVRRTKPRFAIEVLDETDDKKLAVALRKAAEFLLKGNKCNKKELEL